MIPFVRLRTPPACLLSARYVPTTQLFLSPTFESDRTAVHAITYPRGFWKSTDGGLNWKALPAAPRLWSSAYTSVALSRHFATTQVP